MVFKEFWIKTVRIFSASDEHMEFIVHENHIIKAITYFSIFTMFFVFLAGDYYLNQMLSVSNELLLEAGMPLLEFSSDPLFLALFLALFFLFMLVMTFPKYFLIHLAILLFKRKAKYKDTYKAMGYTVGPGYLAIPFFLGFIFALSLRTTIFGLVLAAIFFVCFVSFEIYGIYLRTKAISKVHKMGLWKSFLSVFVIGYILWMLFLIILLVLVMVLFFLMV